LRGPQRRFRQCRAFSTRGLHLTTGVLRMPAGLWARPLLTASAQGHRVYCRPAFQVTGREDRQE
jgi:hypothetical protein